MRVVRSHLLSGIVVLSCWVICTWVVTGKHSPLNNYFLWHVAIPNRYREVHMVAYMVAMLASGNFHQPSQLAFYTMAGTQWFAVGFAVSYVFSWFKIRTRSQKAEVAKKGVTH
jgi:hypothetical protein